MITKKRKNVKRASKKARSNAAKKGWITRRQKAKLDIDKGVEKALKEKIKELQRELATERRKGREIITGNAKEVIALLPKDQQKAAREDYVTHKMDQALRLYGEVTFEAWDLAYELDIDIGDIYDAWDYDSESAA